MTTFSNFPIMLQTNKSSNTVIENGNLYMPGASYDSTGIGSVGVSSGKWYYELRVGHNYGSYFVFGWVCANIDDSYLTEISSSQTGSVNWSQLGTVVINGSNQAPDPTVPSYYNTNTKVVGTYLDLDNNKVYWHGDNNFVQESDGTARTPTAGNGFDIPAALQGQIFYPMVGTNKTGAPSNTHVNFGQDSSFQGTTTGQNNTDSNGFGDFYYAPSTNYLAMCSANMPTSSNIDPAETNTDHPSAQCGAVLYTGNGSSNAITGLGFQPDLVWAKMRSSTQNGILIDSSRGQGLIFSSANNAQQTSNGPFMTSYDSDGFTLASSGSNPNDSGQTYVAWCWRANGGTTASNSDGSITSTVQANQNAGFSIVQTTGNGGNATIGHGLGAVPKLILSKQLNSTYSWVTYHPNQGASGSGGELGYMHLDSNGGFSDYNLIWNDTAPTSSVFSVGSAANVNASGSTYVHYCWSEINGMSKFGYYVGTGTTDGPYIMTNMRPRIIIIKRSDGTSGWTIIDTARYTNNNPNGPGRLELDTTAAEVTGSSASREMDLYSNGYKIKSTNSNINTDGARYIYACWGDQPSKYSNAR